MISNTIPTTQMMGKAQGEEEKEDLAMQQLSCQSVVWHPYHMDGPSHTSFCCSVDIRMHARQHTAVSATVNCILVSALSYIVIPQTCLVTSGNPICDNERRRCEQIVTLTTVSCLEDYICARY